MTLRGAFRTMSEYKFSTGGGPVFQRKPSEVQIEGIAHSPTAKGAAAAQKRGSESGAVMVFLALASVVLFAFAAFAIDMGRIYLERRALQNGADAAALAIADDCAQSRCGGYYDEYAVAELYADANAGDASASVSDVDFDLATQSVTVTVETEQTDGTSILPTLFASVIGYDGLTVEAEATVQWGSPSGLPVLPLVYSQCEWMMFGESGYVDRPGGGFLHRASSVRDGLLPPAGGYQYWSRSVTVFFHGSSTCHDSESGQDLPGGFGWVDVTGSDCEAQLGVGDLPSVEPGASPTSECDVAEMAATIGTVQLIPYFDDYTGTGTGGEYQIAGFGAFYVTGYNFGGSFKEDSLIDGQPPCTGNDRCIQGYLIGDWAVLDNGAPLSAVDHGVYVTRFSS